jgi:hypothetical protein
MIKLKFNPFLAGTFLIVCLATTPFIGADPVSDKPANPGIKKENITLRIAVSLDANPTSFVFTLKNNTKDSFETTPIAVNYNQITIVTPNGKVIEHYVSKDGIKPLIIPAGSEKSWDINASELLDYHDLKHTGTYEISWKVEDHKSPSIFLLKSR